MFDHFIRSRLTMESRLQRSAATPPAAQRSGMGAILYISKAARPMTHGDLAGLLEHARRRNAQEGITGVLLYSEGAFMQYLEGPAEALLRVYAIIKAHPLHFGLIDLVREPISTRAFAEWSMAGHWVGAGTTPPLSEDFDLLAARMAAAVNVNSAARELLAKFWTVGRHAVAPALVDHSQARLQRRRAAGAFGSMGD
jgi:Sensors of blue-light using FAD